MKKFVNKFENDLLEASYTTYGGGLNTGDAWPDGLFTKYGERRYITAAGMPRGMVQVVAPAADSIYGGDGTKAFKASGDNVGNVTTEYYNGTTWASSGNMETSVRQPKGAGGNT